MLQRCRAAGDGRPRAMAPEGNGSHTRAISATNVLCSMACLRALRGGLFREERSNGCVTRTAVRAASSRVFSVFTLTVFTHRFC